MSFAKAFGGVGSPPRVWGQRAFSSASRSISTVHPHACGDNSRRRTAAIRFIGSPPRVWGQHLPHPVAQVGYRFTPTRVGTTSAQFADTAPSTVHPHACGDNARSAPESAPPGGSPPRVWGQRSVMIIVLPTSRFTPTRVGTTYLAACQLRGPAGSPPRVWGQRKPVSASRITIGFTPTRVGTTQPPSPATSGLTVHPHACGDNSIPCISAAAFSGSPPRVWGQLLHPQPADEHMRFTPTRVGTTLTVSN